MNSNQINLCNSIPTAYDVNSTNFSSLHEDFASTSMDESSNNPSGKPPKLLGIPSYEYLNKENKNSGFLSTSILVRIGILSVFIIIAIFTYFKMNKDTNESS